MYFSKFKGEHAQFPKFVIIEMIIIRLSHHVMYVYNDNNITMMRNTMDPDAESDVAMPMACSSMATCFSNAVLAILRMNGKCG